MRIIKGRLHNLIDAGVVDEADKEDYIKAVLTDTEELIDPLTTLRNVYPNLMQMELEIRTAAQEGAYQLTGQVTAKSLEELFGDFYQLLCGEKMDEKRTAIVREAEEAVREEIQRDYETGKISD
jgi:exonuclease SbcD